jgi:hypothetical protein
MEEALTEYARRHPRESAAAFLKRMRAAAPRDDAAIADVEAAIEEHRLPTKGSTFDSARHECHFGADEGGR